MPLTIATLMMIPHITSKTLLGSFTDLSTFCRSKDFGVKPAYFPPFCQVASKKWPSHPWWEKLKLPFSGCQANMWLPFQEPGDSFWSLESRGKSRQRVCGRADEDEPSRDIRCLYIVPKEALILRICELFFFDSQSPEIQGYGSQSSVVFPLNNPCSCQLGPLIPTHELYSVKSQYILIRPNCSPHSKF